MVQANRTSHHRRQHKIGDTFPPVRGKGAPVVAKHDLHAVHVAEAAKCRAAPIIRAGQFKQVEYVGGVYTLETPSGFVVVRSRHADPHKSCRPIVVGAAPVRDTGVAAGKRPAVQPPVPSKARRVE